MIKVNNFFAHWFKEVDIKRYGDDIPIFPLANTVDVYRYSGAIFKHMTEKVLKIFEDFVLQKRVMLTGNRERRLFNTKDADDRTDKNLTYRISKFLNLLKADNVYSIPLRFFTGVGFTQLSSKIQQ